MKAILDWIDQRSGLISLACGACDRPQPGGACWCRVWPCAMLFTFCMQAITGFFLWVYYSPSAQTAWESVYYLQYHVMGGWLLRGIHHYSAHALIAMSLLYVLQLILTGVYRAPRELVFWTAVLIGLFALGAVLTGDLLYYDQNGYSSTKVRTGFLTLIPGIGDKLLSLAIGGPGPDLGSLSLTRFFALHVGVFGGGLILLLIVQRMAIRRAAEKAIKAGAPAAPAWPGQTWRSAVACLFVLGVVLLLTCRHGISGEWVGVFLGSPADPTAAYDAARPEWMLLGVYEFSHYFTGGWAIVPIFIVPGLLVLLFLAMPFIASRTGGHALNVLVTLALLAGVSFLTYRSIAKDKGDEKFRAAVLAERQQAERTRELAAGQGIPVAGALALLRGDPKTQGPKLFVQCASCHNQTDAEGRGIKAEKSSAPNLYHFASRPWIAGILDARQIVGPNYFGDNPKFRGDAMVDFVKGMWKEAADDPDLAKELKEDIPAIAAAVSAEAKLRSQAEIDAKDKELIAKGRALIVERCTDCHRFGDKKGSGAPELVGYGSREWLRGIIANPADSRFYGKKNDRMPAYKDIFTPQEIDVVTDYLRGEWYEKPVAE